MLHATKKPKQNKKKTCIGMILHLAFKEARALTQSLLLQNTATAAKLHTQ